MFSRIVRRSLLSPRQAVSRPPICQSLTTISHNTEANPIPEPIINAGQHTSKEKSTRPQVSETSKSTSPPAADLPPPTSEAPSSSTTPLSDSVRTLLPLLRSQYSHYITAHIHGKPYLLTQGDTLRLPVLLPNLQPGDILRLNRASVIGSRDYTLKAPETTKDDRRRFVQRYLDDRLFVCRAVVMGVESEPMRVIQKTKRRQRHVRHIRSKGRFTVLRVSEVRVNSLEEVERMGQEVKT